MQVLPEHIGKLANKMLRMFGVAEYFNCLVLVFIEQMEWDIKSLLESQDISYTCAGTDRKVKGAAAISVAEDTDLSFCYHVGEKGFSLISQSNAGIIICNSSMEGLISPKVNSEGTKQLPDWRSYAL